eukprot:gene34411-42439_t
MKKTDVQLNSEVKTQNQISAPATTTQPSCSTDHEDPFNCFDDDQVEDILDFSSFDTNEIPTSAEDFRWVVACCEGGSGAAAAEEVKETKVEIKMAEDCTSKCTRSDSDISSVSLVGATSDNNVSYFTLHDGHLFMNTASAGELLPVSTRAKVGYSGSLSIDIDEAGKIVKFGMIYKLDSTVKD